MRGDYNEVDDYSGDVYKEEEEQQPLRRAPRPKLHSIPLRTHVQQRPRKTADDIAALFPQQAQQRPRQAQNQRSTQSYIPHTALPALPDEDQRRAIGKSQLRYIDEQGRQVWREGNRQVVFQKVAPPSRRRLHWLLFVGVGMLLAVAVVVGWNAAAAQVQANTLNGTYGYPRTWQTDAVVGHEDSAAHPSHFIFENLHGKILITEYPGGDIAHAHLYSGGMVYSDQAPVTGLFQDINHDGKPDLLVQIGTGTGNTQTLTFLNNGTVFVMPN